ncbi:uncharacterized protein crybg2 [Tachysurus vachellii]|uniref:uncharacterized protein crybg2 n=1 Tax=Tachysurus vachellii TaxID=175792 RepID=UPI00296B195B|nr:uncharacterized protein crybg2 [Tachysurus vachellii]
MAKSSISQKKSLKHLFFTRSTTDLQECGEKKENKFQSLFKRREKKDKSVESPEAASADEHDGRERNSESGYSTVPRSKKGLFSHSEMDLRKPKRSATFSFPWKKKKKIRNLSLSSSSITEASEVRGHIREPMDEKKIEQSFLRPREHSEVAEIKSADSDGRSTEGEDLDSVEFMLANTDNASIPFIDSSVSGSDGYRTPPEGPSLGSSLTVNNDYETHQSHSEELPDTLIPVEEGSSLPVLTSTEFSHTGSSNSPTRMYEGQLTPIILTPRSTVVTSINSTLITVHHPETSPGAESRDHSLALHQWDTTKPQQILSPDSTSCWDRVEKYEEINASLTLGRPEKSCIQLSEIIDSKHSLDDDRDLCPYNLETGFHRHLPHITDDTIQDNETFRKHEDSNVDHIESSECIVSISHEVPKELDPPSYPENPEIFYSTKEMYNSSSGDNDGNPALIDAPLVYFESDVSPRFPRRSVMVSDPDTATFDLLRSSYTSGLVCSSNVSDLLCDPDQSKQEEEPTISTSLSYDTFNESLAPESISTATDHLMTYSNISDLSQQGFSEDNLEEDQCDEEGIDDPGFLEKTCSLLEDEELDGLTGNNEPVCETKIHENDFYTFRSVTYHLNESVNREYSEDDGNAVTLKTEENQLSGESEAPPGEVNQQLADLADLKPDTQVLRVCVSEECITAPPCGLHAEVSVTDCKPETHPNMKVVSGHSQESGSPVPPQWEDSTGGGANSNVDRLHVDRDDINTQEPQKPVTCYPVSRFLSAEPQGLPETEHTFQQVQGQDTVEKFGDDSSRDVWGNFRERNKTQGGIAAYIRECVEEEEEDHQERTVSNHQPVPRYIPHRSPHAVSALKVTEESEPESPVAICPESDTDMSVSHVGVLSTTLTLRPKVSHEGRDDNKKVHKVSLVNNSSTTNSSVFRGRDVDEIENGVKYDAVDEGTRLEVVEDWKPKYRYFEGESRSFLADSSEHEVSGSTHLYSSHSSSLEYKPTVHSSLSFSSEQKWETLPSAVSLDTDGNHRNTTWWNVRSEVQESDERQTGGRSWAGLAEESGVKGEGGITNTDSYYSTEETDGFLSGVFKATLVELSPTEPEPEAIPSPHDMDTLIDTLKSMAPPVRHRPLRNSTSLPFSSLPPIVEDITSHSIHGTESSGVSSLASPTSAQPQNILPPDLGLSWSKSKDMRSPLAMMSMLKEQQSQDLQGRSLIIAPRASALNSMYMRKNSLPNLSLEEGTQFNSILGTSRLDNSLLFSSYRSEQKEDNSKSSGQRTLNRAASLPEVSSGHDYLSRVSKAPDSLGSAGSTYELSFLTSPPSSLSGSIETSRISKSPLIISSPTAESPTSIFTPPLLHRSLSPESPVKPQSLQLNLDIGTASIGSVGSPVHNGFGNFGVASQPGPDRNLLVKYKAFPDAYLTKEKEHGKLNPRPGKMYIYNRPGCRGQRIEVKGDVIDATDWEFPETISIRVVRGGWVLYEKPDFKGERFALDEDDIELTNPFGLPEDEPRAEQNGEKENGEPKYTAPRRLVIGSLRRVVRDYSVPEICLFPEENAEGKKVVFRDTSQDARIYGFPVKANSIIINAGLWLVFAEPFFQGVPRVLEVGGFPNPAAWGVEQPYVGSLHPLKIREPRVERPNEPKLVIYDKPYFTGKSREIYNNTRDFITRTDPQQTAFMYSVGSLKVIGGIWVGYEKEGFRGHQYLLEEGEYHDWRTWGGCDSELRSVRVIRTDLSNPMVVLFEMSNEEVEEERTFEVTEAIPDVELFDFPTSTRSIHVISGAWVAYSHVDYSGNQYVLEKGFYNNCADWGSGDNRICSIQPILPALTESQASRRELLLYTEPNFQGMCQVHCESEEFLSERRTVQSCRVVGGSWVLYDGSSFSGNQYILSEGDYANLTSMGCSDTCVLKSVKPVEILFTIPSISLFGMECFEGREVSMDTEVSSMMEGGFNPHFLSVRVSHGCWVLCEHSNYRGRQFLLETMEITNWPKFSSLTSIGSLYPIREKSRVFRIRYKESRLCMSVQGGVDAMKTGRVVVSEKVEGQSDVWFYQDGLIKNKLAQTMSLQVVGNVEPGAKVVLWSETRTPIQMWSAKLSGPISSLTFPGLLLDVKGGKTYDKEHVIVQNVTEDTPTPLWDIEFI